MKVYCPELSGTIVELLSCILLTLIHYCDEDSNISEFLCSE